MIKKVTLFWYSAAIVAAVALSIYIYNDVTTKPANNTLTEALPPRPDITVTAKKYSEDYHGNQVHADQLYAGRLIKVTGTVNRIGKNTAGEVYILLGAQQYNDDVTCYIKDAQYAQSLKPGDIIDFTGIGGGKTFLGPIVVDAQLMNK